MTQQTKRRRWPWPVKRIVIPTEQLCRMRAKRQPTQRAVERRTKGYAR